MNKSRIDLLFIQETRIDSSFPNGQFQVNQYITYHKDVKCDSGSIMAVVKGDLAQRRRHELEYIEVNSSRIKIEVIEVMKGKLYMHSLHKQPKGKRY